MITTGWPAASLLATCGSDPNGWTPPFGGRQGTRLKMSLADFATCLTLSTAFAVKPFCSAGLAGAAGAVPVVAEGCTAVVLVSDGLVSDGPVSVGAVVWADGAAVGAAWAAAC